MITSIRRYTDLADPRREYRVVATREPGEVTRVRSLPGVSASASAYIRDEYAAGTIDLDLAVRAWAGEKAALDAVGVPRE